MTPREMAKKICPPSLRRGYRRLVPPSRRQTSYSQAAEDLVVASLFGATNLAAPGLYLDVGAFHPVDFSNTYYFYRRGWRGINIDARPGSMKPFDRLRPRDINLQVGIARSAGTLTFYEFNIPELNGFDAEMAQRRDGRDGCRVVARHPVPTRPLADVLDEYLPTVDGRRQGIDFLTVDVEGLEMQVLESNDWSRFRPRILVVEHLAQRSLAQAVGLPMVQQLDSWGYTACARTQLCLFFADAAHVRDYGDSYLVARANA